MHWIEKSIIKILIRQKTATMKELTPLNVEANLASHYLRHLMLQGYITRVSRGKYELTTAGEKLTGTMNSTTARQAENIKSVIMFYAKNKSGQPLLFTWTRQPYLGSTTLPYDKIAFGVPLEEAVRTAQQEKLDGEYKTEPIASGFVRIMHDNLIVSHMNVHLYNVEIDDVARFPIETRNGSASFDDTVHTKMNGLEELVRIAEQRINSFDVTLHY